MNVSKSFRWEAAHRLPWHKGLCRNLHGHSYRMWVTLEGEPDTRGMVMDFQDIKRLLKPLVDAWDHATLVCTSDTELLHVVQTTGWKHYLFPFDTTAENLCRYVVDWLRQHNGDQLRERGITSVTVRIAETETCYAEITWKVNPAPSDERTNMLKFYA